MNDPNDQPEPGSRSQRSAQRGRAASFSAARGAALIAVAIILGVVLLNAIDDGNNGPVGDGGATPSTTAAADPNSTTTTVANPATAPTTKPVPIPPAQVTVIVLNASGRDGVASTLTNTLKAKGYRTLAANNASPRSGTVVNVKAGKTAPCTTMATLIPGAKVQPMPSPPPIATDADCIVVIGA